MPGDSAQSIRPNCAAYYSTSIPAREAKRYPRPNGAGMRLNARLCTRWRRLEEASSGEKKGSRRVRGAALGPPRASIGNASKALSADGNPRVAATGNRHQAIEFRLPAAGLRMPNLWPPAAPRTPRACADCTTAARDALSGTTQTIFLALRSTRIPPSRWASKADAFGGRFGARGVWRTNLILRPKSWPAPKRRNLLFRCLAISFEGWRDVSRKPPPIRPFRGTDRLSELRFTILELCWSGSQYFRRSGAPRSGEPGTQGQCTALHPDRPAGRSIAEPVSRLSAGKEKPGRSRV